MPHLSRLPRAWSLLALSMVLACYDNYQDPVTKCVANSDNGTWDDVITNARVDSPDRCPFEIYQGRTAVQSFAGRLTGNSSQIGSSTSVATISVYIGYNDLGSQVGGPVYYNFSGSPPMSFPQADYAAGVGSAFYDQSGQDFGTVDVTTRSRGVALGSANLTYTYRLRASITISSAQPGPVTISASVANSKAPVTYRWWRNNVPLSATGSSYTSTLSQGKWTFKVVAKDMEGDSGYTTKTFQIGERTWPPWPELPEVESADTHHAVHVERLLLRDYGEPVSPGLRDQHPVKRVFVRVRNQPACRPCSTLMGNARKSCARRCAAIESVTSCGSASLPSRTLVAISQALPR